MYVEALDMVGKLCIDPNFIFTFRRTIFFVSGFRDEHNLSPMASRLANAKNLSKEKSVQRPVFDNTS
jgi:hypothetical protein